MTRHQDPARWMSRGTKSRAVAERRRLRPSVLPVEGRQLLSTFAVTSLADDGGSGTLRWAVGQADAASDASTIVFDASAFGATRQTIGLTQGQLDLTNTAGITIQGPTNGVTISGGGVSGVLEIDQDVPVLLSNLMITDGMAWAGAGIGNNGRLSMIGCTVSGNTATVRGGGIAIQLYGSLSMTNCTVSGNTAGSYGGGLFLKGLTTSTVTLTDCTISGNAAPLRGAGVALYSIPSQINNTIIAGNLGSSDILVPPIDLDEGIVPSGSHNLIGMGLNLMDGSDNQFHILQPGLSELGDYGGPTATMALKPGSPAIGAGMVVGVVTTDQRGMPANSPTPDIGSFQTRASGN